MKNITEIKEDARKLHQEAVKQQRILRSEYLPYMGGESGELAEKAANSLDSYILYLSLLSNYSGDFGK